MHQLHAIMHRLHRPDVGILLIRIALALVFIHAGWNKVSDIESTVGFFSQIGIGPFLTYVAAYTELIGGIALLVGIFVRYAAILLSITMAVAVFYVHWPNGFGLMNNGYEYALTLLLGSLALVTLGAGKYSLAGYLKKQNTSAAPATAV